MGSRPFPTVARHALHPALAGLPDGAVLLDPSGRVLDANAAATAILCGVEVLDLPAALPATIALGSRLVRVAAAPGDGVRVATVVDVTDAVGDLAEQVAMYQEIATTSNEHHYAGSLGADNAYSEIYTGPGIERILGGPVPEGVDAGTVWDDAVHPEDRPLYDAFHAYSEDGGRCELEYRMVGFDGSIRWVRDAYRPRLTASGREVIEGVVSDITEQRQAAEELVETFVRLEDAHRTAVERSTTDELTGLRTRGFLLERLDEALAGVVAGGPRPALMLLDVDHFKRVNDLYGHLVGDRALQHVARRIQDAASAAGDCVARWGGEEFAVLIADGRDDAVVRAAAERIRGAVARDPLEVDGHGVATRLSAGAARFCAATPSAAAMLAAADEALYAAKRRGRDQARLASELSTLDAVVEESDLLGLAHGLALAASVRQGMPELHCQQVADLAADVASELGLGRATVVRCRLGGLLHDVGKAVIPDAILSKPGPLTDTERAIVERHPVIGEQIVRLSGSLVEAAAVVRHHHERFDGRGYPDGLAGEEIPIEARVVAAADAFSAITSARAYGPERDQRTALAELHRSAGTHLDPVVVDALECVVERRLARSRARLGGLERRAA